MSMLGNQPPSGCNGMKNGSQIFYPVTVEGLKIKHT